MDDRSFNTISELNAIVNSLNMRLDTANKLIKQLWTSVFIAFVFCIVMFFWAANNSSANDRMLNTLAKRCPAESHFERDTLTCVVTYEYP